MGQRRMRATQIALAVTLLLVGMLIQHPSVKALGPTYVGGEVHGIWDLEGSPYIVTEDAIVPELELLIIEPGVEVRFDTNTGILVHGRIVVEGMEGNEVLFTSNQTIKDPGQWKGITVSVFSTENVFEFSIIEYGTHGIRCAEHSSVSIRNSVIRFNSQDGVHVVNSWASVKGTSITNNHGGIRAEEAEIEVIDSDISSNDEYGLYTVYSGATIDSTQITGNYDGMWVQGSEVHVTDSNIEPTMNAIWLSDASLVTTIDTYFPINAVGFDGIQSTLIVQWSLRVRVLDKYSAGVFGATVTVEAKLVDTLFFQTNEDGWIEALIVREIVKTNTEEVVYNPYFINATKSDEENSVEVLVNETKTVNMKLAGDFVAPEAVAGRGKTVNEDVVVIFDASDSSDDDPEFLTTGTFVWTIYDYDMHYLEVGITASHTFNTPGTYQVKLRAEDSFGNWDVDYLEVKVIDITDPVADIIMPLKTEVHETIVLDASASTDNDPEFDSSGSFTWTIGTGSDVELLYGEIVEYEFEKGGTYPVQLVVRDAAGNSDIEIVDVEVLEKEPEEFPYLPLAILALIGIAFVGAANTEAGKYWFLKFLILPLYVKLSRKDILDHFIRGQIYGYLVVHPGDNYTTIKRNLDLKNGTLTYHLDVLEREGFVKSQIRGSKRYYYPKGVKMPDNGTGFPAIKEDIITRVEETPGITVSDLAGLLRVSRQLTNYHLKALIQEGYVYTERKGVRTRCYPVEKPPVT